MVSKNYQRTVFQASREILSVKIAYILTFSSRVQILETILDARGGISAAPDSIIDRPRDGPGKSPERGGPSTRVAQTSRDPIE